MRQADLETLRLIFDAAPIGIAISGPDTRLRMANQKMADMLGYSREELIGRSWKDLAHPDDHGGSGQSAVEPEQRDEAPAIVEKRYVQKSGRAIWACLTARTVVSAEGERLTLALIEDISAQRRSERLAQSLSEQTSLLASIIQKSPLAVILANEQGEITYINPAALELLDVPEAIGALGQSIALFDTESESDPDSLVGLIDGRDRWAGERDLQTLDRKRRVAVHVTAFRIERSGMGAIAFVAKDITLRKQVEEELRDREERLRSLNRQLFRAQEKERARIARDLHDDVTQRLAMVAVDLGFLESWADQDASLARNRLAEVRQQVVDLTETVRNLSHRYHPTVLSHSNLEGALTSLCEEFESHHGIRARVVSRADTAKANRSIATAIYRIAQEALQNAARHSGAENVTLTLDCDDGGDTLSVAIMDDGKGFETGPHGRMEGRPVSGLGLASMEERAAAIRGSLEVFSEPGEGTRIEITAPIADGCDDEEEY